MRSSNKCVTRSRRFSFSASRASNSAYHQSVSNATHVSTHPPPPPSRNTRPLASLHAVDFKTQWLMEQAAVKSGAMGPPDRRSQGPDSSQPVENVAIESKGGNSATAPAHSVKDGQQTHDRATLVIGGAVDVSNGARGSGDGLGATTLARGGSTIGGTGTMGTVDGSLFPSGGDSLEQIYQSTRTWCRTLRRYPNAMEVLITFARNNPRPQSGILFNQYLSDLTGIMYRRLSTTVEEEVSSASMQALVSQHKLPRTT